MVFLISRQTTCQGQKNHHVLENTLFESWLFPMLLFVRFYRLLAFAAVDITVVTEHLNERYCTVFACGTVYYAVQDGF